jgi:hypothetical protein
VLRTYIKTDRFAQREQSRREITEALLTK